MIHQGLDWDRCDLFLAFEGWGQDLIDNERARDPAAWHPIAQALSCDRDFLRVFGKPALSVGAEFLAPEDAEGLIVLAPQTGPRWPFVLAHPQESVVRAAAPVSLGALNRAGLGLYKSMPPVIGGFGIPVHGKPKPAFWWRASFQIAALTGELHRGNH